MRLRDEAPLTKIAEIRIFLVCMCLSLIFLPPACIFQGDDLTHLQTQHVTLSLQTRVRERERERVIVNERRQDCVPENGFSLTTAAAAAAPGMGRQELHQHFAADSCRSLRPNLSFLTPSTCKTSHTHSSPVGIRDCVIASCSLLGIPSALATEKKVKETDD
jgi:hypothetical protein